jgi:hypothetical protein
MTVASTFVHQTPYLGKQAAAIDTGKARIGVGKVLPDIAQGSRAK